MENDRNYPRLSNLPAVGIFMLTLLAVAAFVAFLYYPGIAHMPGLPEQTKQKSNDVDTGAGRKSYAAPTPNVQDAIDAYNQAQRATAAAIQPATPIPNTDATGDSAPLMRESQTFDRQPAGENVPTAEPIAPSENTDQFGSKAVVVAPQETHECRHAQVWTDAGCKNPTPVSAP